MNQPNKEAAAAFEELTLSHRVDELKAQVADAWPNSFRQARFLSAVDFVQSDRLRRMVATEMARIFSQVDLLLVPSLRDEMLTITNFTGHPSLTMRAGFVEVTQARSDWAPDPEAPAASLRSTAPRSSRSHPDLGGYLTKARLDALGSRLSVPSVWPKSIRRTSSYRSRLGIGATAWLQTCFAEQARMPKKTLSFDIGSRTEFGPGPGKSFASAAYCQSFTVVSRQTIW